MKKENKAPLRPWIIIIGVLLFLGFLSIVLAAIAGFFVNSRQLDSGNVALIRIDGFISSYEDYSPFSSGLVSSSEVVEFIGYANDDPDIKAIILEINSPGGTPVASEEIVNAVKRSEKFTVAWIREIGASGGYWVASPCDKIVASRMSITGSIGVLASYLEFSGLLERYNITYERLVGGKYKDAGSPFRELTVPERMLLQEKVDMLHEFFMQDVAKSRNISEEDMQRISDGMFLLGAEAKKLGLVDELGGKEEAIRIIEDEIGIKAEIVEYIRKPTLLDIIAGLQEKNSFRLGQGIGDAIVEKSRISSGIWWWV